MTKLHDKEVFGSQDETVSTTASDVVVLAEPLRLLRLEIMNVDNKDIYVMLFDSKTLPPNGTGPKWRCVAKRRDHTVLDFSTTDDKYHLAGLSFEEGCVVAMSDTLDSLTVTTGDAAFLQAIVRLRRDSPLG